MRIAISTGGGDAPGLNAVIRAAVLSPPSIAAGRSLGIKRGYFGLLGEDDVVALNADSVRGIAHLGGTILRTTNRGNPFRWPVPQPDGSVRRGRSLGRADGERAADSASMPSSPSAATARSHLAQQLHEKGLHVVGVPEDDRQRRERHHQHVRIRHRGEDRARGDRQAAHHGREPRPRDRDGGDGAPRRLHRPACGPRRHGAT